MSTVTITTDPVTGDMYALTNAVHRTRTTTAAPSDTAASSTPTIVYSSTAALTPSLTLESLNSTPPLPSSQSSPTASNNYFLAISVLLISGFLLLKNN